jgi:hypothetical protein
MGLDPAYTPEEIQRIEEGADAPVAVDGADAPVDGAKKRKFREVLTAEAWQYFTQGIRKSNGMYDATCNYCGKVYRMGQRRGTGSLKHHYQGGCKKMPRSKRQKENDPLQMLLKTGTKGIFL